MTACSAFAGMPPELGVQLRLPLAIGITVELLISAAFPSRAEPPGAPRIP